MTNLSNEIVVKKLQKGDKTTFNELFHLHYEALCQYALKFVNNHSDAEEAVQHVFVQFWEKRKQLKSSVPIEPFLFKSTQNHCLNNIKHLKVRSKYAADIKAKSKQDIIHNYDDVEYIELQKRLEDALEELPKRCRMVFKLSRNEQLTYKEIASNMDISVKTVEAQMGKALKFLRIQLGDYLSLIVLALFF